MRPIQSRHPRRRAVSDRRPRVRRSGVALLTTVIVLALVTVLVISFLFAVRSMQRASVQADSEFRLGNLRDTAINLAIDQLRRGTSHADGYWVSQPGAIRTFDRQSGAPRRIYKLYSSDRMTIDDASSMGSAAEVQLEADVPGDWNERPGAYADLNEPRLFATTGDLHFPIVDPRLYDGVDGAGSATPEGFRYHGAHASGGGAVAGVIGPQQAADPGDQRLPMPVRWIYLLRDGTRGTLADDGRFQALDPGAPAAGPDNPISGRIAFWVDDESTKINVNTASEGIAWDTPRAATPEDVDFARHIPVKNEVQRFGGHPASTSLSTVFFPRRRFDPDDPQDRERLLAIYRINPRVNAGDTGRLAPSPSARRQPIAFKSDRLYAGIDELLLDEDRVPQALFSEVGSQRLRQARFLLTAGSQAPEVTIAGTPRVSLWPVFHQDHDNRRTAYDRLMTRAAEIGGRPYYFRRNSPFTDMTEFSDGLITNAELALHLMHLAGSTELGYPRSFLNKYDNANSINDASARNMVVGIVSFMETLRQINLHDNTIAPNGSPVLPYASPNSNFKGTHMPGQVNSIHPGRWVSPVNSRLGGPSVRVGPIGRETTLSEVGLAFSLAAEHRPDGTKINPDLVEALELPQGFKAIQGAGLFEGFSPGQGYTMHAPGTGVRAVFGGIRINNQAPVVKAEPRENLTRWGVHGFGTRSGELGMTIRNVHQKAWFTGWAGSMSRHLFADHVPAMTSGDIARHNFHDEPRINNFTTRAYDPITGELEIPAVYTRGYFIIPSSATTMTLSSGVVTISAEDQRYEVGSKYTYHLQFPTTTVPVPEEPAERALTWRQRYLDAAQNDFANPELLDQNDTVRTVVVRHNDYRLVYMRQIESGLPQANRMFTPHPDYHDSTRRQVHSFTLSDGAPEPGATFQRGLVNGVNYADHVRPDFPVSPANPVFGSHLSGYPHAIDPDLTRDWDNGTGIAPDGAYWTKVDDTARVFDGATPPYFHTLWDGADIHSGEESIAPNQMVPSAVVFGSIPSLAATGVPWTTYLFRPDITPNGHIGSANRGLTGAMPGAPPDHRILDWFWMPVVQPYAVSEPFSTAGKINLNHRLAPFGHIHRATGLHAVMKSERLLAIPTGAGQSYKNYNAANGNTGWRHWIDAEQTLRQFDQRFDSGDVFRFPSEICVLFLVPEGQSVETMPTFWNNHRLTGNNTLERPYANIYPRLTTQSNSYRVHFLVQTIGKSRATPPDRFVAGADRISGTLQGEAPVERYIDPNDPGLPDHVANPSAPPLDQFYQWRIVYVRRFAP